MVDIDKISNRFVGAVVDEAESLIFDVALTKKETVFLMTDIIKKIVREIELKK